MLLFMMQSDLDDRSELGQTVCRLDQPRDRVIDMTAISGDFIGARTRDQAALRPRLAWTGRHIIGIVEVGEALIESVMFPGEGPQKDLPKNPPGRGGVPLGGVWAGKELNARVLGQEKGRRRSV